MNYDEEYWIKVYTRDTAGWLAASWQARGLALEIARKLPKKTGELSLGRRGLEALSGLLRAPWSEIEPFVRELIADGRLEYDPEAQVIRDPGHVTRQAAITTAAERTRRWREKRRERDGETSHGDAVTSQRHADMSRGDQEKRREEKREEEKRNTPPKPPKGGEGDGPDKVHAHYVQSLKTVRPRRRPPALSAKDRKRIVEHLRSGLTVEDLKRAVEGLMHSPHHLGENDRHTEYLELEYALRKPTQMAALAPEPAPEPKARSEPTGPGVPPPPGLLEAMEKVLTETGT